MIFSETEIPGVFTVECEKYRDKRGFFARAWCHKEFQAHGLNPRIVQCNISFNRKKGTLRGMHYQVAPYMEAKLIRCIRGAIFGAAIDIRPFSPTFKEHFSVTLSAKNGIMLYVPEGLAQGFLTLEDNTEVFYQMSEFYAPEYARGIRYNDPAFGIKWPAPVKVILERDRNWPDWKKQIKEQLLVSV